MLASGDIGCRWLVCMAEVAQIHRLSDEESCCLKGVPDLQFGMFGFKNRETSIAFVTKDTTSVGQPCHFDAIALLQVVDRNTFSLKGCTLYVSAHAFNRFARARLMTVLSGVYRRRF